MRLWLAIKCFFLILFARRLPSDAAALLPSAEPERPTLPPREAELVAVAPAASRPATTARTSPASTSTAVATPPAIAPTPTARTGTGDGARGALVLLAILQREGRLIDFLQEDVDGYSDAQIGAAVRDIHRGCRKALAEHLPLEPVLAEPENASVRVDPGFDPARIRLVGNVVGEPPFTGALRHHGWRVRKVDLPSLSGEADASVVAPAEVELA